MCDLNIEKNINKLDSINLEEREEREKKEGRVENEEREKKEDKEVTQLNQGIESSIIEQKDNFGRKKKNDTKKGKHNKNSGDKIELKLTNENGTDLGLDVNMTFYLSNDSEKIMDETFNVDYIREKTIFQ
jgi:hypothetical protein